LGEGEEEERGGKEERGERKGKKKTTNERTKKVSFTLVWSLLLYTQNNKQNKLKLTSGFDHKAHRVPTNSASCP
jgi:hypothetical protein